MTLRLFFFPCESFHILSVFWKANHLILDTWFKFYNSLQLVSIFTRIIPLISHDFLGSVTVLMRDLVESLIRNPGEFLWISVFIYKLVDSLRAQKAWDLMSFTKLCCRTAWMSFIRFPDSLHRTEMSLYWFAVLWLLHDFSKNRCCFRHFTVLWC